MAEAQEPAVGILTIYNSGDSKMYHVRCECGNDECSHEIEIESDICGVQVHIYVTNHTKFWEKNRWRHLWQLLTKGYISMQTTTVLSEQSAINYAATLTQAVYDVKHFVNKNKKEKT